MRAEPLDPDIAEMERRWRDSGIPGFYVGRNGPVSRERARNVRAMLYPKPKLPTGKLERFAIPGPNGPIAVEVVRPVEGSPIGTLVYYHGGGYVIGDIDSHQAHAIRLANRSRVVVLNVDYRLAPEHPFPQGVNDAYAAARWASGKLGTLGGAAIARHLAEQPIERHRSRRQRQHPDDDGAQGQSGASMTPGHGHDAPPSFTMVTMKNSATSASSARARATFLARWRRRSSRPSGTAVTTPHRCEARDRPPSA